MLGKKLLQASAGPSGGPLGVEDVFSTSVYTGNSNDQVIYNEIALADGLALQPGDPLGGGYFAGFISHTADGVATHALIVAPRATGATGFSYPLNTNLQWKTSQTSTPNTTSLFDGAANTAALIAAGAAAHPAAQFCNNLNIGGYTDWYLPALFELEIAYFNLKPTINTNATNFGINDYSVPKRTTNYSGGYPTQANIAVFQSGGVEEFAANYHWTSTENSVNSAWSIYFSSGYQNAFSKTSSLLVRAFRRIPISDPSLDPYRRTSEGGLVWTKSRNFNFNHSFYDTARGATKSISSNSSAAETTVSQGLTSFESNGYRLGNDSNVNQSSSTYASWTFRKAPKFFDIVTYTGNGANRTIAHNLGSVPGCIMVKRTDASGDWQVYHRTLANTEYLVLNTTAAKATGATRWNSTTPTNTQFSLGTDVTVNASGGTYVAYLFAHDAGGFGDSGNESAIKCGSFTTSGSGAVTVDLGWEPQYILAKRMDSAQNWYVWDTMRGWNLINQPWLAANLSNAESNASSYFAPTATGFSGTGNWFGTNANVIYIAIRRGLMKTPTDATKVFTALTYAGSGGNRVLGINTLIPDYIQILTRTSVGIKSLYDRLRGDFKGLLTYVQNPEGTYNASVYWDSQGIRLGSDSSFAVNASGRDYVAHAFRRAKGFFDVVAYTGTGVARTVPHNLGVAPELMIVKRRNATSAWYVYVSSLGNNANLTLDSNAVSTPSPQWDTTTPTASVFSTGGAVAVNVSASTYIAYLFATLPGISKVGSYTGTGTTLDIDCGFTAGARYVLIKRTDLAGDWYVWDTARGITTGNDPYLLINTTAVENTVYNYIDPLAVGFRINASAPVNISGGNFIYLAIA